MMGLVWVDDINGAGEDEAAAFLTMRGNVSKIVGGILDAILLDIVESVSPAECERYMFNGKPTSTYRDVVKTELVTKQSRSTNEFTPIKCRR